MTNAAQTPSPQWRPYSLDTLRQQMHTTGAVSGVVLVDLDDLIDWDLETLNEIAIARLTGEVELEDISYRVVGAEPAPPEADGVAVGAVLLEVTGVVDLDRLEDLVDADADADPGS